MFVATYHTVGSLVKADSSSFASKSPYPRILKQCAYALDSATSVTLVVIAVIANNNSHYKIPPSLLAKIPKAVIAISTKTTAVVWITATAGSVALQLFCIFVIERTKPTQLPEQRPAPLPEQRSEEANGSQGNNHDSSSLLLVPNRHEEATNPGNSGSQRSQNSSSLSRVPNQHEEARNPGDNDSLKTPKREKTPQRTPSSNRSTPLHSSFQKHLHTREEGKHSNYVPRHIQFKHDRPMPKVNLAQSLIGSHSESSVAMVNELNSRFANAKERGPVQTPPKNTQGIGESDHLTIFKNLINVVPNPPALQDPQVNDDDDSQWIDEHIEDLE